MPSRKKRKPNLSKLQVGDAVFFGRRPLTSAFPLSINEWQSYFIQRGIQKNSQSIWNHVGIIAQTKPLLILEARFSGVGIFPLEVGTSFDSGLDSPTSLDTRKYEWAFMRPAKQDTYKPQLGIEWAKREAVGDQYDLSLITAMAKASRREGLFGIHRLRVNTFGDSYWICSELVADFYIHSGVQVVDNYSPTTYQVVPTPGDLFRGGHLVVVDSSL